MFYASTMRLVGATHMHALCIFGGWYWLERISMSVGYQLPSFFEAGDTDPEVLLRWLVSQECLGGPWGIKLHWHP